MAVLSKGGTPVLGLDIGAAFIKAVEMHPSKGSLAITGVGVLPTPPGCIVNDEIVDPIVLAQAVKQLLAESNIKTKNVIVSVAGQSSVVVRVIEVPRMNEKELAETMRWEIDRHIPFAPEEVIKDYSPILRPDDDPNSANMSVLLAVAQNNLISGAMETILAAGLTPVAIDVELLAGARAAFDVDDSFLNETVALVNMGATKTDVAIFEKGSLAFPRTIPVAGNAMTEAIASALGVDWGDAERLKKQHGVVPADASSRIGVQGGAAPEDTFTFGDFGGAGFDFEASTPGAEPATGFAETTEGPVFGEPTFTGPSFESPEPGTPSFGGPSFDAPMTGQAAEGPSFDMPDFGPANTGPVAPEEPDFGMARSDTPPFTAPQEAVALTPDEPPLAPASVPEVVTEAERHRADIANAFLPVLAELAQEMRRSLEYYSTRANNARVDRLLLFGGTSNMPGLVSFLESELGVPIELIGLPNAVSVAGNAIATDYLKQVSVMLPVAVGLASRDAIVQPVLATA